MKLAIAVVVVAALATTIAACPDESNCVQCSNDQEFERTCELCEDSFLNIDKKSCDKTIAKPVEHCKTYYLQEGEAKCLKCADGYVVTQDACVKCTVENCAVCTENQSCFGCFNSMKLFVSQKDSKDNSCSKDEKCSLDNCSICMNDKDVDKCFKCSVGFAVSEETRLCVPSPANCNLIAREGDTKCLTCDWGFYLALDGSCLSNPAPGPTPPTPPSPTPSRGSGWFWFLLIVAVLGVAGYFGYTYYIKNRLEAENEYLSA
jgi:hypothetical protein